MGRSHGGTLEFLGKFARMYSSGMGAPSSPLSTKNRILISRKLKRGGKRRVDA